MQIISESFDRDKVILLIGPRQVGKTTLILALLEGKNALFLNGDDPTVRTLLDTPNTAQLQSLIGGHTYVFIDEAQRIPNIGLTAKLIHDQMKQVHLIMSGSSSFELSGLSQEPLTGRKLTFYLYPLSWEEYENKVGYLTAEQDLPNRLVYGFYPEIVKNPIHKEELLYELVESYLYKDILALGILKKPDVIYRLLQLLAFQVGNEVSYNELGRNLQIDTKTVISYIDLLEQAYVIYRLGTFSRNLRNEIKTNKKIYFYDNGVRNTLIRNLQPISLRNDIGALWENFLMAERMKMMEYSRKKYNRYFWRTKTQQEIDYLEEYDGGIHAYEFKWNPSKKASLPSSFEEEYKPIFQVITRSNFREFILKKKD
ncbi:ATP-binding protein [Algoriphagus aquatilis]|uniref:ATP-binding protein n=1 Tax=Algoriphagus aquatilis TaxID=490186 RepID=A0ABW0BY24_9BACT